MKHIYLNLKRFDIPAEYGGVNRIADFKNWGAHIVNQTEDELSRYDPETVEFSMFIPEAHILPALGALRESSPIHIGCQGVYREDVSLGGNFGAFTSQRTAASMRAAGCSCALIGHCEERRAIAGVLTQAGVKDFSVVNRILNQEVRAAAAAELKVLYCIGEDAGERSRWREVLAEQIHTGLDQVDRSGMVLAYEPVWAIGPGKVPPDREQIQCVGDYVKQLTGGMDLVYGGGLKRDNAGMLASIPSIDGGLIALTRFEGEIGFYPEEYLEIIRLYMGGEPV